MTPIPENALPNYDKRTIEDPSAFFRTLFHLRDIKEERAIPAVVKDYDAKTGEVTVLPMAKYTFDTRDGEAEVDRETVKVRALKICQGGYSISLPIFKGDTGWLIAGDRRCGAAIEKNGEIVVRDLTDEELKDKTAKPDDCSILNFENGFFVPFSWELEDAEKNPNGNFVIRNARDKICEKELENEFGVVRDDKGDDVPFIEDLNGKTHSIDGAYHGRYAWSMIELEKEGSVNLYGQGRKFTVRSEGLYLDDRPLKFLNDLVLTEGEGIEITKILCEDGKIEFKIGNKGVIALEQGDNITIEPVDGKPGTFKISSIGGDGTLESVDIDSPDNSVSVEKEGTDTDPIFHLGVARPGNGTITIRRNGVDIGSFSMNQNEDGAINIDVPVTSVDKKSGTFGLDVKPTTGDVKIENTGITGAHIQQSGAARYAQITGGTDTTHNDISVKTKDVTITLPVPLDIDATTFENVLKNAIHVTLTHTGSAETLDRVEKISLALNLDAANHTIKINESEIAKFFGTEDVDITIPDIVIDTSAVTSGKAVGGLSVDSLNKHKIIASSINIPTKLKNPYALTIKKSGSTDVIYDGSAAKTITLEDVTIPDIVIDTSAVTSGKAVGGLSVDSLNKHKIIASAIDIPAEQVNADWNATSGKAKILNKPTLATVATSGSYNDLSNKPTIPTALQGSDYIDIPTTGTDAGKVKAKVPTDGSKGLVTTNTNQQVGGNKSFTNTIKVGTSPNQSEYASSHIYLKAASGNPWITFFNASYENVALLQWSPVNNRFQIVANNGIYLGGNADTVTLKESPTSSVNETDTSKKLAVATCGWVNDKYKVTELVEGDNITITPDATNPKKLTIAATGGAKLDHSFSWEGTKKADIAASADISVDSKKIQGSGGIDVTEENRVITIKGNGEISGYITPEGTYDYEVTGLEWDSTNHRIVIHKVKKTYENGLLKTRESVTDEYIQFVEETA